MKYEEGNYEVIGDYAQQFTVFTANDCETLRLDTIGPTNYANRLTIHERGERTSCKNGANKDACDVFG